MNNENESKNDNKVSETTEESKVTEEPETTEEPKTIGELRYELIGVSRKLHAAKKEFSEAMDLGDDILAEIKPMNIAERREKYRESQIETKELLDKYVIALMNGVREELSADSKLVQLIEDGNIHKEVDHILRTTKTVLIRNKSVKPKPTPIPVVKHTNNRRGYGNKSRVVGITQSK